MAGKSMAPGGGGRFAAMVASGKSPALAAFIGRKKYGNQKMAAFSAQGRKRAAKKRHKRRRGGGMLAQAALRGAPFGGKQAPPFGKQG